MSNWVEQLNIFIVHLFGNSIIYPKKKKDIKEKQPVDIQVLLNQSSVLQFVCMSDSPGTSDPGKGFKVT